MQAGYVLPGNRPGGWPRPVCVDHSKDFGVYPLENRQGHGKTAYRERVQASNSEGLQRS